MKKIAIYLMLAQVGAFFGIFLGTLSDTQWIIDFSIAALLIATGTLVMTIKKNSVRSTDRVSQK